MGGVPIMFWKTANRGDCLNINPQDQNQRIMFIELIYNQERITEKRNGVVVQY
jgi:hypothetical protein